MAAERPHVRLARPATARELARRLPSPLRSALVRAAAVDPHGVLGRRAAARFVEGHAADVRGAVLEFGSAALTRRVGGRRVTRSEVLDARPGNPDATIVADLSEPGSLPPGAFDCVLLQGVPDVANAVGALAPGGVLLATVPARNAASVPGAEVRDLGRGLAGVRVVRRG